MHTLQDEIKQSLYEYQEIGRGGNYRFFETPIGTCNGDGNRDEYERTNMLYSGRVPDGNSFFITGIRVPFFPFPGFSASNDMRHIYRNGALKLNINERNYLTLGPLAMFPPLVDLYPHIKKKPAALGRYGYFAMTPILYVTSFNRFSVQISIDSRVELSSVGRLGVILDGYLQRDAQ